MGQRKCCCCTTEGNCSIKRDAGKDQSDPMTVELTDDYQDTTDCSETPKTCETTLPNQYQLDHTGLNLDFEYIDFLDNCHCVGATPIEHDITLTQDCVDISEDGEPEKLACIVTITMNLVEADEPGCNSGAAAQQWIYKVGGPIDIRNGAAFEVPFFDEIFNVGGLGTLPVCVAGVHPDAFFLREV